MTRNFKKNNSQDLDVICDYFWESPNVNFRVAHYVCHVFSPTGKPRIPHLLCCLPAEALAKAGQGFAVGYCSFTLDAADLPDSGICEQHPRILQRQGKIKNAYKKMAPPA